MFLEVGITRIGGIVVSPRGHDQKDDPALVGRDYPDSLSVVRGSLVMVNGIEIDVNIRVKDNGAAIDLGDLRERIKVKIVKFFRNWCAAHGSRFMGILIVRVFVDGVEIGNPAESSLV